MAFGVRTVPMQRPVKSGSTASDRISAKFSQQNCHAQQPTTFFSLGSQTPIRLLSDRIVYAGAC